MFTQSQIETMRKLRDEGYTLEKIGEVFGTHKVAIHRALGCTGFASKEKTAKRIEQMRAMRENGVTFPEIARRFGVTHQRVQQLIGGDGRRSARIRNAQLKALYEEGATLEELCDLSGLTREIVRKAVGWKRPAPEVRFWKHVDKSGDCWMWTGGKLPTGYGNFNVGGRSTYAHRFSYEIHYGPIPEGMEVCHRCDVPGCVRPDHLFLGTHADNMHDRNVKGRTWRGSHKAQPARVGEGA